jgi:methionyl-tRNA formyltransferase
VRLVYLGTPEVAVLPMRALHRAGHEVVLVVTRADKRRGRGAALAPSPVKVAARDLGIAVTDQLDDVLDVEVDLGVVVAYGRIIPTRVLDHVPMVNLHFSLLPRWRGAAPVERAILAGDERTGVCVMAVEEGLDTGGVYRRVEVPVGSDETADELRARLVEAGTTLLVEALAHGLGDPVAQVGEVTYAEKLSPGELELDWERPAVELHRQVRIGNAWTTFRGRRLKVWRTKLRDDAGSAPGELRGAEVGTGQGGIVLIEVQPEGKPRVAASDWLRGVRLEPGERLGR